MSDSENEIDYTEILNTLNEKNVFLQHQEQNRELQEKYDKEFEKYSEMRTTFFNMKNEFELNQIQMFNSNILLADSRNQLDSQLQKLKELEKKIESLSKKSQVQQVQFIDSAKKWNKKINDLSTDLDENTQLIKIREGQSNVDFLNEEIRRIQENYINVNYERREHINDYLIGVKQLTDELMEETKDCEEKLKKCTQLETELNEFGTIINDIQKQLN